MTLEIISSPTEVQLTRFQHTKYKYDTTHKFIESSESIIRPLGTSHLGPDLLRAQSRIHQSNKILFLSAAFD